MTVLADQGVTRYVITVGATASAVEKNAARELKERLEEISGARFRIVRPAAAKSCSCLAVGPEAALAAGLGKGSLRGLGDEGLVLRGIGANLVLTGGIGASRGTLYAVFDFLENELGCRWWTPTAAFIPKLCRVEIGRLKRRFTPRFEYRHVLYANALEPKWAARQRLNGLGTVPAAWGGSWVYRGWVHTFASLAPREECYQEHPEWFSLNDGERTDGQLCLSNPELARFVAERVKEWLRETPAATIVSVSQNDNKLACECRQCQAIDRREGSAAGSLLLFVNAVAEAIEPEFPQVAIDTLAYQYTRRPPRHLRPRRNVIVRLCSFECDFLHSFTHPNNRAFYEDLQGWARVCERVYIWDYVVNYAHFVQPYPNWFVLDEHVRNFADNGVKGVFEQANHQSLGGELVELRAWVLAKLLWDPTRDGAELIDEFLRGYYGRAASHLAAYLRCIHDQAMATEMYAGSPAVQQTIRDAGLPPAAKSGCFLDLNSPTDAPYLAADTLLESLRHLQAAESAVGGDRELLARVRLARLPACYVALLRWRELRQHAKETGQEWPLPKARTAAFREFARVARQNAMTRLGEHWTGRDLEWLRRQCGVREKSVQPKGQTR